MMPKVLVTVTVEDGAKTFVKHISAGVDRETVEVSNGAYSFEVREFEGENLFVISPPTPAELEQSHIDAQEQQKIDAQRREENATADASESKTADAKTDTKSAKVDDKSKDAKADNAKSSTSDKK